MKESIDSLILVCRRVRNVFMLEPFSVKAESQCHKESSGWLQYRTPPKLMNVASGEMYSMHIAGLNNKMHLD